MAIRNFVMLLMFSLQVFAQQENKKEAIGIIISLHGVTQTVEGKKINPGDLLYKGDALKLVQGDYCKVFWADGDIKEYDKNFIAPSLKSTRKEILNILAEQSFTLLWYSKAQPLYAKQVYRSGSDASSSAITPRNTRLLDVPSQLIWRNAPDKVTGASEYTLHLRSYENDYFFEETVLGNAYTVRKDIGIESGIKYFWFAESVNANTNDAAESVWFYVLNNEDKYEFQSAMEGTRDAVELMQDSIIQRLLMASVYVRYQLYKDALDITTSVLNEQPHNIMALKIQARIYEIIQQPIETKRLLEITQRYMENQ